MAIGQTSGRWGRMLRYTSSGVLLLLTAVATWVGVQWYLSLIGVCTVVIFILGRRRIFRPAVARTANEVVCRYIPWYEGSAYLLLVVLPLMGVASIAAGYAPGNPVWLRFAGILLLGVTPLMVYASVRMWRRCILRIAPSTLTVRLAVLGSELTQIRRERVESITPKMIPNAVSGHSLQVEIAYRPADLSNGTTETVLLGLQLSVQPTNLLNALVAWKDGTNDGASELLDRIERILRGREMVGV